MKRRYPTRPGVIVIGSTLAVASKYVTDGGERLKGARIASPRTPDRIRGFQVGAIEVADHVRIEGELLLNLSIAGAWMR